MEKVKLSVSNTEEKKLPSKWSKEIIDRYVYPINNGDPGQNIADYIKSIC